MIGDLSLERPLQDLLDQTCQQATLTGQSEPVSSGLINQLLSNHRQPGISGQRQPRRRRRFQLRRSDDLRFFVHEMILSDPPATAADQSGPPHLHTTLNGPPRTTN